MNKFTGFDDPRQNWSKLPHAMIENLSEVETLAEMKVILYILRHTWGFQDFGEFKRITLDEFCNGRKRKDQTRIDAGTGLSQNAIKDGIKRAISHGFIIQEGDGRDAGRRSHCYCLRMSNNDTLSNFDTQPSEFDTQPSEFDTRSEKDTLERYSKKESLGALDSAQPAPCLPEQFSLSVKAILQRQHTAAEWGDIKAAEEAATKPRKSLLQGIERKLSSGHPAIQAYREEMEHYPRRNQYQDIIATVGSNSGLESWREIVKAWKLAGWNTYNVGGMLDFFRRGEVPGQQRKTGRKRGGNGDIPDAAFWQQLAAEEARGN